MYALYSVLLSLSFLLYAPVYFLKTKLIRRKPLHLAARLGCRVPSRHQGTRSLWIHAVSVGEVLSLQRLIRALKAVHPDWSVYFSTLTISGFDVARNHLSGADRVFFVPLDFRWVVNRFFRSLEPDLFVLAESEFWPNLLRSARRFTRGVLLLNGRISERSFRRYRRLGRLPRRVLSSIDRWLVQTELDGRRLSDIGVEPGSIEIAGNLKCEMDLPLLSGEQIRSLRTEIGASPHQTLVVAGSTHRGEENVLLDAYARARARNGGLKLILAPRHPERTGEVEKACAALSLRFRCRTAGGGNWDVLILDTIGELYRFYAIADVTFIGGSLVPWGGQNLLEPAFYSKPVFFGPHMDNFALLAKTFLERDAARVVDGPERLMDLFLPADAEELKRMGERAKQTLESLRGATEKSLKAIEDMMSRPFPSS